MPIVEPSDVKASNAFPTAQPVGTVSELSARPNPFSPDTIMSPFDTEYNTFTLVVPLIHTFIVSPDKSLLFK